MFRRARCHATRRSAKLQVVLASSTHITINMGRCMLQTAAQNSQIKAAGKRRYGRTPGERSGRDSPRPPEDSMTAIHSGLRGVARVKHERGDSNRDADKADPDP